jgi:hypothetical protein
VREERCPVVFQLAVRLLRGETIDRVDEHGRHWRATATALCLVAPGSGELDAVVQGNAYDVAEPFR